MVAQPVTQVGHDDYTLPLDCVLCGDSLDVLSRFPDNSIDAIVCDPPAGINFMNKPFDDDRGGRDAWIAWLAAIMREALRVTKPGGHAFVWALPRTSHWTATALEDSGWEIREKCYHLFGSGFPKSMSLDKAIDKHLKAEREVVGKAKSQGGRSGGNNEFGEVLASIPKHYDITAPATPEAAQWAGWGTATKPAVEEWILCRKPLSEKSIAENCLKWGTGGLAIDACRVAGPAWNRSTPWRDDMRGGNYASHSGKKLPCEPRESHPQGRFPSNLLLSHSVFCVPQGTKRVRDTHGPAHERHNSNKIFGNPTGACISKGYTDDEGYETVEAWLCSEDCPIAEIDRQSGIRTNGGGKRTVDANPGDVYGGKIGYKASGSEHMTYGDTGGASRYFQSFPPDIEVPFLYCSKSSRTERNRGCEGLPERDVQRFGKMQGTSEHTPKYDTPEGNNHPTVKSLSLMKWLVKLVGVPGGVILDPFCGSGSTLVACVYEGLHYIGIDQDQHYVDIAEARIAHAVQEVRGW